MTLSLWHLISLHCYSYISDFTNVVITHPNIGNTIFKYLLIPKIFCKGSAYFEKQSVFCQSSNTQMCGCSSSNSELKGIWSAVIPKIFSPYWYFMWCSFSYQYHHDGDKLSPMLNSLRHRCHGSALQGPLDLNAQVLSVACSTDRHGCLPVLFRGSPHKEKGNFKVTTKSSTLKKIVVLITSGTNWNLSPGPVWNLAHLCQSQICCALQVVDKVSLQM